MSNQWIIADRWEELDHTDIKPGRIMNYGKEMLSEWTFAQGFLEYHYNPLNARIQFTDDRMNNFGCTIRELQRPNTVHFSNGDWWHWESPDKLLRAATFRDNRGVEFPIDIEQLRRKCSNRIYFTLPREPQLRDQSKATLYDGIDVKLDPTIAGAMLYADDGNGNGAFYKVTQNKEAQMGSTSNATARPGQNEVPLPTKDRAPQFEVYFTINGLPQEFTEKEVNGHVATMLKLGQHVVTIKRVIVDSATANTLQNGREQIY